MSNSLLDTNWQEVAEGKKRLTKILQTSDEIPAADLFEILENREFAPDDKLPDTKVGIERERFIVARVYRNGKLRNAPFSRFAD